jgi:hypothetical protein
VVGADASGGEDDGLAHVGGRVGRARLDLLGRDADGLGGQLDLVELAPVVEQRVDAPGPHGLQHLGHGGVDIGRRAAALVEERLEGGRRNQGRKRRSGAWRLNAAFTPGSKPEKGCKRPYALPRIITP